ncbi:MAG: GGDEF domain-containing protein [Gammaproteobacteria bacterium]|nr:GGDEF domain-containing protein [Gammaproteobacteria bacterium]
MGTLDPRTLVVVTAITLIVTSIAIVLGGFMNRRVKGVPHMVAGYLMLAVGLVLISTQQFISLLISLYTANLIILLGFYTLFMGVRLTQWRPALPFAHGIAFFALIAILFAWLGMEPEQFADRVIVSSIFASVFCLLMAKELLVEPHRHSAADIYTGILFTIIGIGFLVRALAAGLLPMGGTELVTSSHTSYTFMTIIVLNLLLVFGYLMMMTDRLEFRLRNLADTDYLTGMQCRRAFVEQVGRLLSRAKLDKQPVSLIVLDIDDFKKINDTYGHTAGDEVLKDFASNMKDFFRVKDVIGRIGGEEFGVVLDRVNQAKAVEIAERLRKLFEATLINIGEHHVLARVSVGVATVENGNTDFEELYAMADEALYEAKKCGKNCVRVYAPNNNHSLPSESVFPAGS